MREDKKKGGTEIRGAREGDKQFSHLPGKERRRDTEVSRRAWQRARMTSVEGEKNGGTGGGSKL